MTLGTVGSRGLIAGALSAVLCLSLATPAAAQGALTEPELLATLELPEGDIEYQLELGTLHYFEQEDAPFVVQVLDGCSINDHLWLFAAGFSGSAMPLDVVELRSGRSKRVVLPAFEPGEPVGSLIEPEALAVCRDVPAGGLPPVSGTAVFTSADDRGRDYREAVRLLSEGREDGYRRLITPGSSSEVISRGSPVFVVDQSSAYDELMLLAEDRTPRRVEGVVFFGDEGMLPPRDRLEKALDDVSRSRVRRALQTAKKSRVPQGIVEDLGLRGVDEVYHVSFELDSLGADAYLTQARWIRERGEPVEPPQPVAPRFSVELARANGETTSLPLVGPLEGSDAEGVLWEYRNDAALVQVIDGCTWTDSFWTVAAAITDEPLELIVTDTSTGLSSMGVLWTDREEVARLSDTASLPSCP